MMRHMKNQDQASGFHGFHVGIKWLFAVLIVLAAYVCGRNSLVTNLAQSNASLEAAKVKQAESNTLLEVANEKINRLEKQLDIPNSEITAGDLWKRLSEGDGV